MLTLSDTLPARNCEGTTRRDFLRIGSLALGGLTLADLLALRSRARAAGSPVTDRSVVLLFLQGGPPHIELFDPKMSAPSEFRSITGETPAKLPGVTFGGTFPRLASLADRLAVVRSYGSGNSGHTYLGVTSGGNELGAAMGAIYARVAGINHPRTGIPANTLVLPEAVEPGLRLKSNFETGALPTLTSPGTLGPSYEAFNPAGGGELGENMELRVPSRRFRDRRGLLEDLDRLRRDVDSNGTLESAETFRRQAFEVILGGVADAFDLSREDPRTLAMYDTSGCFRNEDLQKWGDMRRATNLLGKQMLLARRLCEAGCGFVTVSDCGWDYHANGNSPKNMAGIHPMGAQVDRAVSAFIEDVHQRGLSDRILLVVTGEMGRTPRINRNGGRDHYGKLTSLLFSGGGLRMGQVIGRSDRHAAEPASEPYGPRNLLATILHTLFDVGELRVTRGVPREILSALERSEPIREL